MRNPAIIEKLLKCANYIFGFCSIDEPFIFNDNQVLIKSYDISQNNPTGFKKAHTSKSSTDIKNLPANYIPT